MKKTIDTVREQIRMASSSFSRGIMALWFQEIESMVARGQAAWPITRN